MSWWIYLNDNVGTTLEVTEFVDGGTYEMDGSSEARLNITYNYSEFYYQHLDAQHGLHWLSGKTGQETVDRLRLAVNALGTERDDDYWKSTPGNAGAALARLLQWAELYPDGIWELH